MSDCCATTNGGERCEAPAAGREPRAARAACPECGRYGKPVEHRTLEHLLTGTARPRLVPGPFLFCISPDCPVVYFTADGGAVFHKVDLTVRVTAKETADPVPVCYCYSHTRADILREVRETGKTTIPDRIKAGVKAGTCACEVKNPQGSCCLGNVTAAVKWAEREAAAVPALQGGAS